MPQSIPSEFLAIDRKARAISPCDEIELRPAEERVRDFDDVIIPVSVPVLRDSLFEAQVFYEGKLGSGSNRAGIMNEASLNVTFTLSEPFYARYWFPVKQVLSDKADSVFIFINFKTTANT